MEVFARATAAGTQAYARRFPHLAADHFRVRYGLTMSSIGLSLAPQPGRAVAAQQYAAVLSAGVAQGCNLLDLPGCTASPGTLDALGQAVEALLAGGGSREELILCSRGGLVAAPGSPPERVLAASQALRASLHLEATAIAGGHCLEPTFLALQLQEQLTRYRLDALDVFYLESPELQQAFIEPQTFHQRLVQAFAWLEETVAQGRIRFYGISTGVGLLAPPQTRQHLFLPRLMDAAQVAGGPGHHFRFIQFPYNLGELDAVTEANQFFRGVREGREVRLRLPLLAAARQYALVAMGCSGLMGGAVLGEIPEEVKRELGAQDTDAQCALYFNRSTPGLTTTLVNTADPQHLEENLAPARRPILAPERFWALLQAS